MYFVLLAHVRIKQGVCTQSMDPNARHHVTRSNLEQVSEVLGNGAGDSNQSWTRVGETEIWMRDSGSSVQGDEEKGRCSQVGGLRAGRPGDLRWW